VRDVIATLNGAGYWPAALEMNSHPYSGDGPTTPVPGDYSETMVGDASDTSPYRDEKIEGISTTAYIRSMGVLIQAIIGRERETRQGDKR
jgi:hypothetical protein